MTTENNQRERAPRGGDSSVDSNVIELIRVSTMAQAGEDRAGIPAQHEVCRRVAAHNRLTLKWPLEIVGVSGSSVMYSPEMKRLQEIVKSGECAGVVTREVSRLMRPDDFSDFAILEVLKEHGVKLYTESGIFDLSKANDRLMMTVHAGMSGYEKTLILNRLQGGRESKRHKGLCVAKSTPFGVVFDRKTEQWSYDVNTIDRVKMLFTLFTTGETNFKRLAVKTGIGYHSISNLLRNPIYTGWYVIDKWRDPNQKATVDDRGRYRDRRKVARPPEMVHRHKVIEIGAVTDAVFAQAQTILQTKREMQWRRNRDTVDQFLFRGLLRCGECGGRMITLRHAKSQGEHIRDYYLCVRSHGAMKLDKSSYTWKWRFKNKTCGGRRMRREKLDAVLEKLIDTQLSDASYLMKLMEAQRQAIRDTDYSAEIAALQHDLKTLAERRAKLTDLYLDRDLITISKDEYKRRLSELAEQEQTFQTALTKMQPTAPLVSSEYLTELLAPYQQWSWLKPEEKRALLLQTIPVFNVSASKEASRGDFRTTEYFINGFFLSLVGGISAVMEAKTGSDAAVRSKASRGKTRINSGDGEVVCNENHLQTVPLTDHPFPPVTSDRSIYIQLQG